MVILGLAVFSSLVLGGMSFYGLFEQKNIISDIYHKRIKKIQDSAVISIQFQTIHNKLYKILNFIDTGIEIKKITKEISDQIETIDQLIQFTKDILDNELLNNEKTIFEKILAALNSYKEGTKMIFDIADIENNDITTASVYINTTEDYFTALSASLKELENLESAAIQKDYNSSINSFNSLKWITLIIIIATVVILVFIIQFISSLITKPLKQVVSIANMISTGDIKQFNLQVRSHDEIAELANSFNQMNNMLMILIEQAKAMSEGELNAEILDKELPGDIGLAFKKMINNLRNVIENVKNGISQLTSATKEFEASSEEQTSAATEQASGITEISATVEELSITAKQIARNTGELLISSQEIMKILNTDQKQLEETVSTLSEMENVSKENSAKINELSTRSKIINEMVSIITEVANKTNLLSLNASIEAARAGEYGRGFSVVSSEIRELSKETIISSKKVNIAANDIQNFIEKIMQGAKEEVLAIQKCVELMKKIFHSIEEVGQQINNNNGFIQKIDVSTKQQENGSKQTAETMKQMSGSARQSSEIARQSMIAIRELVSLSDMLEQTVEKFK